MGGQSGECTRMVEQFVQYDTHQRPSQSLDGRTPADEMLN